MRVPRPRCAAPHLQVQLLGGPHRLVDRVQRGMEHELVQVLRLLLRFVAAHQGQSGGGVVDCLDNLWITAFDLFSGVHERHTSLGPVKSAS